MLADRFFGQGGPQAPSQILELIKNRHAIGHPLFLSYAQILGQSTWKQAVHMKSDTDGQSIFLNMELKILKTASDVRRIEVRYPLTFSSRLPVDLCIEGYVQRGDKLSRIGVAVVKPHQRTGALWYNTDGPQGPLYCRLQLSLPDGTHLMAGPTRLDVSKRVGTFDARTPQGMPPPLLLTRGTVLS